MMNSCLFIGRIASDINIRKTNGYAIATFTIAISRDKPKDKIKEGEAVADFPRITCFGKIAENVFKYSCKGKLIGVTCRVQTGNYKDKTGNTVYTTDFIAGKVDFLEWNDSTKDKVSDKEMSETNHKELGNTIQQTQQNAIPTMNTNNNVIPQQSAIPAAAQNNNAIPTAIQNNNAIPTVNSDNPPFGEQKFEEQPTFEYEGPIVDMDDEIFSECY